VKKPDTILDELHEIRRQISERTKGMSDAEMTAYFNQRGATAAKKYGFVILQRPVSEEEEANLP